MAIHLTTPSHVHFCKVAEHLIFLDTLANRYFALPPALEPAFTALMLGDGLGEKQAVALSPLVKRGILSRTYLPVMPQPTPQTVPVAAVKGVAFQGSLLEAVEALRLRRQADKLVADGRLNMLIEGKEPEVIDRAELNDRTVMRAAAAFAFVRSVRATNQACVAQAFATSRFLARRGIVHTVVFGVRLNPFSAHCWVVSNGIAINEDLDELATFRIIAVFPR